ncbi:hypothetical protein Taro_042182 [Colocasia esculenta]|uniref:Uncharacterized protein n=1 Tax=Colocasia esculenta TaxID=4460 RepID=A0A843WG69_COLES|nr:hypothetical protein [Colocasia esculenta]
MLEVKSRTGEGEQQVCSSLSISFELQMLYMVLGISSILENLRHVADFYISDNQRGARALACTMQGAVGSVRFGADTGELDQIRKFPIRFPIPIWPTLLLALFM